MICVLHHLLLTCSNPRGLVRGARHMPRMGVKRRIVSVGKLKE